jgi:hypothetical protein
MSVSDFKFFTDNDYTLDDGGDYDGASWIWTTEESMTSVYGIHYSIIREQHYGIYSLLSRFEGPQIVNVKSITGPDGFEHNFYNDGTGWGFDILSDLITVEYFRIHL